MGRETLKVFFSLAAKTGGASARLRRRLAPLLLPCLLPLCGCSGGAPSSTVGEDAVAFRYARRITMVQKGRCYLARLVNPWDTTKVLDTYLLLPPSINADSAATAFHLDVGAATVIRVPLSRAIVYTSVHTSLINRLGALTSVAGVSDSRYITQRAVTDAIADGSIADLGNAMNPDVERMLLLAPDALLVSPFENSGGYGRAGQMGIPVIECADYMETSPLGRAEWMRFYGILFGRLGEADSLFHLVEREYNDMKIKCQERADDHSPALFCGSLLGSVWYMPGGGSVTGVLYRDAGADYVYASDKSQGSLSLSLEKVLSDNAHTPIWLISSPHETTYGGWAKENVRYTLFDAWKNHDIYCVDTSGPYYEEYPFLPHLLLRNIIEIVHPELIADKEYRYYKPLK